MDATALKVAREGLFVFYFVMIRLGVGHSPPGGRDEHQ
jgi:hypothetical protein